MEKCALWMWIDRVHGYYNININFDNAEDYSDNVYVHVYYGDARRVKKLAES